MPNDVFEFKKFIIKQDKCAMKVGTDAVLLGSWVKGDHCKRILDIGTGTGIIALMLAQKINAKIIALEIDSTSYEQARQNIDESAFLTQIIVLNQSFQVYWKQYKDEKFDLIVTNPPYFVDSLKSNDSNRSIARHADVLPFPELIEGVKNILSPNGRFCLILPKKEAEIFRKLAEQNGLHLNKMLRVRSTPDKTDDKRHIMEFEFTKREYTEDVLYIRTEDPTEYSASYKHLTKDYYLNF